MGIISETIERAKQGSASRAGNFREGVMRLMQLRQETEQRQKEDALTAAQHLLKQAEDPYWMRDATPEQQGAMEKAINTHYQTAGLAPIKLNIEEKKRDLVFRMLRDLQVNSQKVKSAKDKATLRALGKYQIRSTVGSKWLDENWVDVNNAMRLQGEETAQPGVEGPPTGGAPSPNKPPATAGAGEQNPPGMAEAFPSLTGPLPGAAFVEPAATGTATAGNVATVAQPTAQTATKEGAPVLIQPRVVPGLRTFDDWIDQITDNYSPPYVDMPPEQQRLILAEKKAALVHILESPLPPEAIDAAVQEAADMESAMIGTPSNPARIRAEAAAQLASTKTRIAYDDWARTHGDLAWIVDATGQKRLRQPSEWPTPEQRFVGDQLAKGQAKDAETAWGQWPAAKTAYEKEHPYETRMKLLFGGAALKPDGTLKRPQELQSPWEARVAAYLPMMDAEAALKQVYNENQDLLKGANEDERLRISEENLAISQQAQEISVHAEARQTAAFYAGQEKAKQKITSQTIVSSVRAAPANVQVAGPAAIARWWLGNNEQGISASRETIANALRAMKGTPPKEWVRWTLQDMKARPDFYKGKYKADAGGAQRKWADDVDATINGVLYAEKKETQTGSLEERVNELLTKSEQ